MLTELEKWPTKATGASEDQLALRKKMTEELIIEESKHRRGDRAGAGGQAGADRPGQARVG
jgi:hypothetical protein